MAKAGLIEEMMNDAIDSALDNESIEEETDEEIEKVGRSVLRMTW
jgi:charged multivesicular body protein 3